jgi:hypothetical protein
MGVVWKKQENVFGGKKIYPFRFAKNMRLLFYNFVKKTRNVTF